MLAKLSDDPALPREAPNDRALLGALINRLTRLVSDIVRRLNLVLDGYRIGMEVAPDPGVAHRGRETWLKGVAGQRDSIVACLKGKDDTYRWLKVPPVLVARGQWDPPSLSPGGVVSGVIAVPGAMPGDPAVASHDQIGARDILISAHVESAGNVRVILRNDTGSAQDIPNGVLTVVVFQL